jgi:K+-transporting ATPase ATPase C chain
LATNGGTVIGSERIGQSFTAAGYFHPRPSAAGSGYDATASGGSNLGSTNPKLRENVRRLADEYRRRNDLASDTAIPIDAVTGSGSGLDPHISPANAALQIPRIAKARGLSEDQLRRLVAEHTQGRQFGLLGEPRVSVLALNLALDRLAPLPTVLSAR